MEEIIYGRNGVLAAFQAKSRKIFRLIILDTAGSQKVTQIKELAFQKKINVQLWDRKKMDALSGTNQHQGVIAVVTKKKIATLEDLSDISCDRGEPSFLLVLDRLEDPRNLGALIRTAEVAGVHGIILSKHESCGLTPTVAKASAGAIEYMPIVRVSNLATVCEMLKKKGLWLFGADPEGDPYWTKMDYRLPLAIVLGSEGQGLKKIIKKKCDFLVSIPMRGVISSLNVTSAGSILMYEVVKQRNL